MNDPHELEKLQRKGSRAPAVDARPSREAKTEPQLPEMALQQARELHRFYLNEPGKPYTAGVLDDCIETIERLQERCGAYKGQVEAGAAEIERLKRCGVLTDEGTRCFVRRCKLYLDDRPGNGGHSDVAGSNAYELIQEAIEHLTPSLPVTAKGPDLPTLDEYRNNLVEECARVAEAQAQAFLSPGYAAEQPMGSFCERFACEEIAKAIRALAVPSANCGGHDAQS